METCAEILLAEDEAAFRDGLALLLETEGYSVRAVADGEQALEAFRERRPDLVLLDVMMPRRNGYAVCADIRAIDPDVPVMFLTAKSADTDNLRGFGLGADDYLVKTISEAEKLARISAVLRRCRRRGNDADAERFGLGDEWVVDARQSRLVARNGKDSVDLTLRELEILRLFSSHPEEVFSRDALLTRFWGLDFDGGEDALSQAISRLRVKLGRSGSLIRTVHGQGYRFSTNDKA